MIPGKKKEQHTSVTSPLNNDVLNYTSIVCAITCSYHSLRPCWLKSTAVDRPAASTEFKKGFRHIVPPYLDKGIDITNLSGNWAKGITYRLASSILQITPWLFVRWDLTPRYCPLLRNFLLPDSSFSFPFGFWFFWLKTCQGYQRLSPPPLFLICSLSSSLVL